MRLANCFSPIQTLEERFVGIWTKTDYLVCGKRQENLAYNKRKLDSRSQSNVIFQKRRFEQHFDQEFCLLLFFIPDDFIRDVVKEYAAELEKASININSAEFV
jgi:AraC family transcriptional regulator, exoenzyme S synthesis regulatory protein ExsA